jgi:hypothetical protein
MSSLLRPNPARRPRDELALHTEWSEVVPVVPILRSSKGAPRQELDDAWFVPLIDIGDGGKGGKYLMLPPGYTGTVPPGYIVMRPRTFNSYLLLRSIVASDSCWRSSAVCRVRSSATGFDDIIYQDGYRQAALRLRQKLGR